jgi:hypothetical protein
MISSFSIIVLVLNRRRIGHIDVVIVSKCPYVWMGGGKRDVWARQGAEQQGLKMGQLILSMGPMKVEVCILVQRATAPSKKVFF